MSDQDNLIRYEPYKVIYTCVALISTFKVILVQRSQLKLELSQRWKLHFSVQQEFSGCQLGVYIISISENCKLDTQYVEGRKNAISQRF